MASTGQRIGELMGKSMTQAAETEVLDHETEQEELETEVETGEQSDDTEDQGSEGEDSEVVVTIGEESPPSDEEENRAPEWVRELRKTSREKDRRIRELEQK